MIKTFFHYVMSAINWTGDFWVKMADVWIPFIAPNWLLIGGGKTWWHNTILVLLWSAAYLFFAWLYVHFVGRPVKEGIIHLWQYNVKVLPWWHVLLFLLFLYNRAEQLLVIHIRVLDINLINIFLLLPIIIPYLIKAKWRVIYFPFLQILAIAYYLGALFMFFPAIAGILGLQLLGVLGSEMTKQDYYVCPNCNVRFHGTGTCPYCNGEIETRQL